MRCNTVFLCLWGHLSKVYLSEHKINVMGLSINCSCIRAKCELNVNDSTDRGICIVLPLTLTHSVNGRNSNQ